MSLNEKYSTVYGIQHKYKDILMCGIFRKRETAEKFIKDHGKEDRYEVIEITDLEELEECYFLDYINGSFVEMDW